MIVEGVTAGMRNAKLKGKHIGRPPGERGCSADMPASCIRDALAKNKRRVTVEGARTVKGDALRASGSI